MEALVSGAPRTGLRPYAFMVAWGGVLTLAYRGFPQPLVNLKSQLYRDFPELPPGATPPRLPLLLHAPRYPLTLHRESRKPRQQVA